MEVLLVALLLASCSAASYGARNSSVLDLGGGVMVQMFEWRWTDIARECEEFLAPKGYAAITISPPNENLVIDGRPWYERYQAVSYKLKTRSGDQKQLANMVKRCNAVGVRVVADVVINHMTGTTNSCVGTGGSKCNDTERSYPGVPYTLADFNKPVCEIKDWHNDTEARVCELFGLHDLNQTRENVRKKIVKYMNHLVDIGIAGFRIDAARHIYPTDLAVIYSRVRDLSTEHGFEPGKRPFIYQEVRTDRARAEQYVTLGRVTDFTHAYYLCHIFKGLNNYTLADLFYFEPDSKKFYTLPENTSMVFLENHDLERDDTTINYKQPKLYKMALAFMLGRGYSVPKILSSFDFADRDDGPPSGPEGRTLSPFPIAPNGACAHGWLCQHRWRQIYNMALFRKVIKGTQLSGWWDNKNNQIAFSMGNKGFIAINGDNYTLDALLETNLPAGVYCDLITGDLIKGHCQGRTLQVRDNGCAQVTLSDLDENGVLAILDGYTESSLSDGGQLID